MARLLLKAAPFALVALLAWSCWDSLPGGRRKFDKGRVPRAWITAEMLPQRGEDDPRIEGVLNPLVSAAAREAARRAAEEEEERRRAEEEARLAAAAGAEPPPPLLFEPFTLRYEAVLRFGGKALARISGRVVPVGGALEGFDDEEPPVLARVNEATVEIRHRGETYVLDLGKRREVVVRPSAAGPEEER